MTVALLAIDPYDAGSGLLFPLLLQRIIEYGKTLKYEVDGIALAENIGQRMMHRDPQCAALAFLQRGKMVGHAIATIEKLGSDIWVFVQQCRLDPKVDAGDAVERAIQYAEEWGRQYGATRVMFGTHRSDAAWARKHGFEAVRHMLVRPIGEKQEGAEVA